MMHHSDPDRRRDNSVEWETACTRRIIKNAHGESEKLSRRRQSPQLQFCDLAIHHRSRGGWNWNFTLLSRSRRYAKSACSFLTSLPRRTRERQKKRFVRSALALSLSSFKAQKSARQIVGMSMRKRDRRWNEDEPRARQFRDSIISAKDYRYYVDVGVSTPRLLAWQRFLSGD